MERTVSLWKDGTICRDLRENLRAMTLIDLGNFNSLQLEGAISCLIEAPLTSKYFLEKQSNFPLLFCRQVKLGWPLPK